MCKLVHQLSDSRLQASTKTQVCPNRNSISSRFFSDLPWDILSPRHGIIISIRPPVNFYTTPIIFTYPESNRCKSCLYSAVWKLCQPHLGIVDTSEVINSTNFNMCYRQEHMSKDHGRILALQLWSYCHHCCLDDHHRNLLQLQLCKYEPLRGDER